MQDTMQHPWELAGLGRPPYRVTGVETRVGPIHMPDGTMVGAPGQPMGTCDYCGQGIKEVFRIASADNRRFEVGCDCVRRAYQEANLPVPTAVQRHEREKRQAAGQARDRLVRERLRCILDNPPLAIRSATVRTPWGEERGLLDEMRRVLPLCGAAGRARHLKRIEAIIHAADGQ